LRGSLAADSLQTPRLHCRNCEPLCWFNSTECPDCTYVLSRSELMQCSRGVLIESAASDPRNL